LNLSEKNTYGAVSRGNWTPRVWALFAAGAIGVI
jgi:hypothetical protein